MKRIVCLLLFLTGSLQSVFGLTLYENKKANAVIVIPEDACPVVKFAADEMKACLKKSGDVDIEIKTIVLPGEKTVKILIGDYKS